MTPEEAREIMSKVTFYWELGEQKLTQNQINEAIDMAIKALEQNIILDKIRAEFISLYPKNYAGEPELSGCNCVFSLNKILQIIDKYKTESEE